jgi:hypothetical protein
VELFSKTVSVEGLRIQVEEFELVVVEDHWDHWRSHALTTEAQVTAKTQPT